MAARRVACWHAWPNCSLNPRNSEKRLAVVHVISIPTMKFGAHMSASGGVWRALQRGRGIRCEIVQVFVKNNMQWLGKPFPAQDVALYASERKASPFPSVFAHAGSLINLGASAPG